MKDCRQRAGCPCLDWNNRRTIPSATADPKRQGISRGRLRSWLDRYEKIARRRQLIQKRLHGHATKLILSVRFLPGLRIAIPLACAYSGIPAGTFSGLSLLSAFGWAGAIMLVINFLGPTSLSTVGIQAWWTPIIPAVLVLLFFRWLARADQDPEPPMEQRKTQTSR